MRGASLFPGRPLEDPGAQVQLAPSNRKRQRRTGRAGADRMHSHAGLGKVARFTPESEQKALGFAHGTDKAQKREVPADNSHRRKAELLARFGPSSKVARASKPARATGEGQSRGLGASRMSPVPHNRPHCTHSLTRGFRGQA